MRGTWRTALRAASRYRNRRPRSSGDGCAMTSSATVCVTRPRRRPHRPPPRSRQRAGHREVRLAGEVDREADVAQRGRRRPCTRRRRRAIAAHTVVVSTIATASARRPRLQSGGCDRRAEHRPHLVVGGGRARRWSSRSVAGGRDAGEPSPRTTSATPPSSITRCLPPDTARECDQHRRRALDRRVGDDDAARDRARSRGLRGRARARSRATVGIRRSGTLLSACSAARA